MVAKDCGKQDVKIQSAKKGGVTQGDGVRAELPKMEF